MVRVDKIGLMTHSQLKKSNRSCSVAPDHYVRSEVSTGNVRGECVGTLVREIGNDGVAGGEIVLEEV